MPETISSTHSVLMRTLLTVDKNGHKRGTWPRKSISERIWSKVKIGSENVCWPWAGSIRGRYGRISYKDASLNVTRVIYFLSHGEIPNDKVVRHTCDNPICCNPTHLLIGTHADNVADRQSRGRTNAPKGSKNGQSKLTEHDVLKIRILCKTKSQRSVARIYKVNQSIISDIILKKSWKHV